MKTIVAVITALISCAAIATTVVIPVAALAKEWNHGRKEDPTSPH